MIYKEEIIMCLGTDTQSEPVVWAEMIDIHISEYIVPNVIPYLKVPEKVGSNPTSPLLIEGTN